MPHGNKFLTTSSSSRLLVYLFLRSGRSRSPTRYRSFRFFVQSIGPCRYMFIPTSSLNPPYNSKCFSSFILFLSASLSLSSTISLLLSCSCVCVCVWGGGYLRGVCFLLCFIWRSHHGMLYCSHGVNSDGAVCGMIR